MTILLFSLSVDFTPLLPLVVVFNPNSGLEVITIAVNDDLLEENDETIALSLAAPSQGIINPAANTAVAIIIDDDDSMYI